VNGVMDRNSGLDTIRIIAAGLVVLAHSLNEYGFYGFGGLAVDVFFTLSGYVISSDKSLSSSSYSFFSSRIKRIYPPYLFSLAVAILAGYFFGRDYDLLTVFRSIFLLPNLVGEVFYPIHKVGWSLGFEMFFYLGFTLFLLSKRLSSRGRYALLFMFIIMFLEMDGFAQIYVLEFLLGVLIRRSSLSNLGQGYLVLLLGIIMYIVAEVMGYLDILGGSILLCAASSFIVLGGVSLNVKSNFLPALGRDYSYHLYLLHPFGVNAFSLLVQSEMPAFAAVLLNFIFSLLASIFVVWSWRRITSERS
jgi:exopolysaccharide production protein ExoZ